MHLLAHRVLQVGIVPVIVISAMGVESRVLEQGGPSPPATGQPAWPDQPGRVASGSSGPAPRGSTRAPASTIPSIQSPVQLAATQLVSSPRPQPRPVPPPSRQAPAPSPLPSATVTGTTPPPGPQATCLTRVLDLSVCLGGGG